MIDTNQHAIIDNPGLATDGEIHAQSGSLSALSLLDTLTMKDGGDIDMSAHGQINLNGQAAMKSNGFDLATDFEMRYSKGSLEGFDDPATIKGDGNDGIIISGAHDNMPGYTPDQFGGIKLNGFLGSNVSNLSYFDSSDNTIYVYSSTAVIERTNNFSVYDIKMKGKDPEEGDRIRIVNVGGGKLTYHTQHGTTIAKRGGSGPTIGQSPYSFLGFIYADMGGGVYKWISQMDAGN